MKKGVLLVTGLLLCGLFFNQNLDAQTTEFTYQGSLKSGGAAANGNFDFEFAIFDAAAGGNQVGSTVAASNVPVTNGVFSVKLDFGNLFITSASSRFMEIRVRQTGGGAFTTLTPRQLVASAPFAMKSIIAANAFNTQMLGSIDASQYVLTTDARLSDARSPLPNSANYIQNTTVQQSSSNFNVSGTGTANSFNALTQFNIGGSRVLFSGNNTVFVGIGAGTSNTIGVDNSFLGRNTGTSNTDGDSNSFFGRNAGTSNVSGNFNSFFGAYAGEANKASNNAFFGRSSGQFNTSGIQNSFFGTLSGQNNIGGDNNAYFGYSAGQNATGNSNSFFGSFSGASTSSGAGNSFFGTSSGQDNTTGTDNAFFGVNTGRGNTTGIGNSFFGRLAGRVNTTGGTNTFIGYAAGNANTTGSNNTILGANADVSTGGLSFATAIGAGAIVTNNNTLVLGRSSDLVITKGSGQVDGDLRVNGNIFTPGVLQVNTRVFFPSAQQVFYADISIPSGNHACYTFDSNNTGYYFGMCSSSIRYKTNVQDLPDGLETIRRLRPVSFNWKANGRQALGLIAEEASEVEPLLAVKNKDGVVESINYDGVTVILVNAVKEQQAQIERQQQVIKGQQERLDRQDERLQKQESEIEALKKLVCSQSASAQVCQPPK